LSDFVGLQWLVGDAARASGGEHEATDELGVIERSVELQPDPAVKKGK